MFSLTGPTRGTIFAGVGTLPTLGTTPGVALLALRQTWPNETSVADPGFVAESEQQKPIS